MKAPGSPDPLGAAAAPHRAIWRRTLPRRRLLVGLLLAATFCGLTLALRPWIAQAWGEALLWWMHALELPGYFVPGDGRDLGVLGLAVPVIAPELPAPQAWLPLRHAAVLVLLWWATGQLADAAKPLAFFVRMGVLVHAASVLFFMFWSASFVHGVPSHVASGLRQAWYLMLALPWIHLMTYYLFPFAAWQCAALTLASLGYLFVLVPLQYALHAALAQQVGLILLPLLNLVFGVLLPIVGVVALYGWGMGWSLPRGARNT